MDRSRAYRGSHIESMFLSAMALFKTDCAIARVRHVHSLSLPTLQADQRGHAHAYCSELHNPETNDRGCIK